jgi:hypothetical protein
MRIILSSLLLISLFLSGINHANWKYLIIVDSFGGMDSSETLYLMPHSDSMKMDLNKHSDSERMSYYNRLDNHPYNVISHNIILNDGIRLNPSRLNNLLCCEHTTRELLGKEKLDSLLIKYRNGAGNFNHFFYDNRKSYEIGNYSLSRKKIIRIYAAKVEANFCLCNIEYDSKSAFLQEAHLPIFSSIIPLSDNEKDGLKIFFSKLIKRL